MIKLSKKKKGLSKKEKDEYHNLIVSYRVCTDILVRNKIFNIFFIMFGGIFLFYILKDIIDFVINPSSEIPHYIPNYYYLIFLFIIAIMLSLAYFKNKFSFEIEAGTKRYIRLRLKENAYFALCSIFFLIIAFVIIIYYIFSGSNISKDVISLIFSIIIVSISFGIIFLFLPLYSDQYDNRDKYFSYAKKYIEKLKSHVDKVKAYTSLSLIHSIYQKNFSTLYGKNSLVVIKLYVLPILALKVMKLDVNNKRKQPILKQPILSLLSRLESIDPLKNTEQFVKTMNAIEKQYGDEFSDLDKKVLSIREKYFNVTPAKISIILAIISGLIGISKFWFGLF